MQRLSWVENWTSTKSVGNSGEVQGTVNLTPSQTSISAMNTPFKAYILTVYKVVPKLQVEDFESIQ